MCVEGRQVLLLDNSNDYSLGSPLLLITLVKGPRQLVSKKETESPKVSAEQEKKKTEPTTSTTMLLRL